VCSPFFASADYTQPVRARGHVIHTGPRFSFRLCGITKKGGNIMSLRWDSPKEEWEKITREWNKTAKEQRREKDLVLIQNILSVIVLIVAIVFLLTGRL
jgi:hypothetical protein